MANDTVLVIGLHRPELAFGDMIAAQMQEDDVDVLRISHGIPQPRTAPGQRFLSQTQHHEIYLQLHQQVRGRYRLLVDLHRGMDEAGVSADVMCHDDVFLGCLRRRFDQQPPSHEVRLVHIRGDGGDGNCPGIAMAADLETRTWIPPRVWQGNLPLYVGLEIYLPGGSEGSVADRVFTRSLIRLIRECVPKSTC